MGSNSLTVVVRVQDPLEYADTTVTMTILDVNDNAPEISPSFYEMTLAENTQLDTVIVDLTATDMDTGNNKNFE